MWAVVAALGAAAPAAAGPPDASITVLPEHYRWSGQDFDDLDTLEGVLMPRTPQTLRLDACGAAVAPGLKAAAYRFRHLQLELRVLDAGVAACAVPAASPLTPVGLRQPAPMAEAAAVERWWLMLMP
jgi:hypothetical protein